ncbi:hypothetical protein K458DRAFT_404655 [Lentithecium fluviatile CBS 122367]|uniref:Uncharacterized protein n=1 Tax=Lentithecium fluviatile CBS 122367 TaxID=1168545 RepID=A0A6G1IZL1_9PLEO|nr:hypothetical protein K458DRAFT_404655 [Lentithecium fluviatile CBS 122367]
MSSLGQDFDLVSGATEYAKLRRKGMTRPEYKAFSITFLSKERQPTPLHLRKHGMSYSEFKEEFAHLLLSKTQYVDTYRQTTRPGKEGQGRNPFKMSCDAVMPYTVVDGYTMLYVRGNVTLTAMYINYMKATFLPGVLGLVSEALALRDDPETSVKRVALLRRFDQQFAFSVGIPRSLKDRLWKKKSEAEYSLEKDAWISRICSEHVVYGNFSGSGSLDLKESAWRPEGFV